MSSSFTLTTNSSSPTAIISEHLLSLVLPITRTICSSPFNRIRIIQQTQNDTKKLSSDNEDKQQHDEATTTKTTTSSNVITIGKQLIKQEGILSLWKGFSAQLANVFIIHYTSGPITRFVYNNIASSPLVAYIVNSLVTYPFEQCKTILLVEDKTHCTREDQPFYNGMIDYFIRRSNESGLASHYHGFIMHVLGSFIYRRSFPIVYQIFKSIRPLYIDNIPSWCVILSEIILAQLCIASTSAIVYPLDTICRRLQLQGCKKSEERKFTNSIQCAKKIIKEEGILSLYQGFQSHCLSAFSLTLVSLVLHSVFGIH